MSKKKLFPNAFFVTKIANAEDEATGDAYETFQYQKVLGPPGLTRIERDKARTPEHVFNILLKKNADLPHDDEIAKGLVTRAIRETASSNYLYASHVGWRQGRTGFVHGQTVLFAENESGRQLQPPLWLSARQLPAFQVRGDLEQWKEKVAKPAAYSDLMQMSISCSNAALLIEPSGHPNFGINAFGGSKAGKTTTLLAGTSVYGIGVERNLPNWSATPGGFLETARLFNDLVMPLNEVGLLSGKRKEAYGPIRERIYAFSEGRDKTRNSLSTMATSGASSQWRGIFFSTSEHSFNEYAALSGETRSGGEYARCLDVPAVRKGQTTVFNRFPNNVPNKRKWAQSQLISIRKACEKQCGTALMPFLLYLSKVENLPEVIEEYKTAFLKRVKKKGLDNALVHAASNFALIYAGGALGIDADVLPWDKRQLLKAILRCFDEAISDALGHENAATLGVKELRKRMAALTFVDIEKDPGASLKGAVARRERAASGLVYTVSCKEFGSWFPNQAQRVAALRWLFDRGLLELGDRNTVPSASATEWAERTIRWGGIARKSFVFRLPGGWVVSGQP